MTKDYSLMYQFLHVNYKLRTHVVYINCFECQNKNKKIFYVHNLFWAARTGKSMNNLLSFCGLVVARISASEKDLPVNVFLNVLKIYLKNFKYFLTYRSKKLNLKKNPMKQFSFTIRMAWKLVDWSVRYELLNQTNLDFAASSKLWTLCIIF